MMSVSRSVLIVLSVLVLVGSVGVGLGIPAVAAQESPDDDLDDDELTDQQDPETVYADVDSQIRVMSWEYDDEAEMFTIVLSNDGSDRSRVSIMEIIELDGDREGALGFRDVSVRADETVEVEISAQLDSGAAGVTVMTEESINNGEVIPIIYDDGGISWVDGAATWTDVQIGVFVGI